MSRADLLERLAGICVARGWTQAVSPFDFDTMPTTAIDGAFRITVTAQQTVPQLNYAEDRFDLFDIWLAKRHVAQAPEAYQVLTADLEALYGAIVRDGDDVTGEYTVTAGAQVEIGHENGQEFAVGRLQVPLNYEVSL